MATKQLKKFLECNDCHVKSAEVQVCNDPYCLEINDEEVEVQLCDNCYSDRVMEI